MKKARRLAGLAGFGWLLIAEKRQQPESITRSR
jgi:hypothetical protein